MTHHGHHHHWENTRDVAPLGPVETIDVAPATLTFDDEDGGVVHHAAVVMTFVRRHPDLPDALAAVCAPIIVPVEVLHHFDERYLAVAGEAIRVAELGNAGGDAALAADVAGIPEGGLYKYAAGEPGTTFLAGSAKDGERATGMLRRSTCSLCGTAIFGDVADRGACLSCDPPVDVEAAVELTPPEPDPWRCSRCGSGRWVSASLTGPVSHGGKAIRQCVPCGHYSGDPA